MKKLFLLLALATSTLATVSMQTNGARSSSGDISSARDIRTCKALVQKMERSPSSNSWLNRVRTWKCRGNLSPDNEATALVEEAKR